MADLTPASGTAEPVTGRSIWDLVKSTAFGWSEINAPRMGAALSFYTMLSIAPLLVMSIGLAGLVFGRQAAQGQVAAQLENLVGWRGREAIQALLQHSAKPVSGIVAVASGLLMLLFGASGVLCELRDSLNEVWGVKGSGSFGIMGMIKYRFFSFAMLLGVGFLLLVSLLLSAAIAAAEKFVGAFIPAPAALLGIVNVLISFLAVTVLFAMLYKVVPDVRIEWRDVWIGAGVTSLLFSLGKFLIGLYLGTASVGSAYGAAGSLVAFLVWVYYSAQIFFLGAGFTHRFALRHGSLARTRPAAGGAGPAQAKKFLHTEVA